MSKDRSRQTSLDEATTTEIVGTFYRCMAGHALTVPGTTATVQPGALVYIGDPAAAAGLRSQVDQWRAVPVAAALKAARNGEVIVGYTGTIGDLERAVATTGTT